SSSDPSPRPQAPGPLPKLPPALLRLRQLLLLERVGVAEVLSQNRLGVGSEVVHVEVAVGGGHELERLTDLGGAVVVLDGITRAIERADVGTAVEVVLCDVDFVACEAVAQEDHALPRVGRIFAVREPLYERLE